jgi:hypothetical protein
MRIDIPSMTLGLAWLSAGVSLFVICSRTWHRRRALAWVGLLLLLFAFGDLIDASAGIWWRPRWLVTAEALVAAAALICGLRDASSHTRHRLLNTAVLVGAIAIPAGLAGAPIADLTAYSYALHLESKWIRSEPNTRAELESLLALSRASEISPEESLWGRWFVSLKPGERMVQYRILGVAPLDVVYDRHDHIQSIITSYE